MPTIKVKENGVWKYINEPSSNADTLDGKHAKDFALKNDILNEEGILKQDVLPSGYPYISEGYILPETTLTVIEEVGVCIIVDKFQLIDGKSYTVNYNGIEYVCVAKEVLAEGLQYSVVGNFSVIDGVSEPTDEPFTILCSLSDAAAQAIGGYGIVFVLDGATEVVISIIGDVVQKIDKSLLPDIDVSNLVNGSGIGSVRSTIASEDIGDSAFAFGYQVTASGHYSHAEGNNTTASGDNSHAEGNYTTASGYASHSEGHSTNKLPSTITSSSTNDEIITAWNTTKFTLAKGQSSHAEGQNTLALNKGSHAEGSNTTASGDNSHAEGQYTTASGHYSHAEGRYTTASGNYSHAEGIYTIASGQYSHAEGYSNKLPSTITSSSTNDEIIAAWNTTKFTLAKGGNSHAEGNNTLALGSSSHAEGTYTIASSENSHAEGTYTIASSDYSHAEGYNTTASGYNSHAEGNNTLASGRYSHAEGQQTTASGRYSHAEGQQTTAFGQYSHAEGQQTTASGQYSHAEGQYTIASGDNSHAEGSSTTASGSNSHAEGHYTKASGENQHVQGLWNIEDTSNKYAHIVGNGDTNARSNAHTLDWDGNAWFKGDVYVGSTSGTNRDDGSKKLATEEYVDSKTPDAQLVATKEDIEPLISLLSNEARFSPISLSMIDGKMIAADGNLMDHNSGYKVSEPIEVAEGDIYKITTCAHWAKLLYAFYDSENAFVYGFAANGGADYTIITEKEVVIPNGVKFMRVSTISTYDFLVSKKEIVKLFAGFTRTKKIADCSSIITWIQGKAIHADGHITDESGDAYQVSNLIEVSAGMKYFITATHHYNKQLVAFYDSDGNYFSGIIAAGGADYTTLTNHEFTVPGGAVYMRVGINAQFAFDLKVEVTVLETNTKKEFEGKKWVPLGDSLTAGTNTSKCYFDYIEEQTGIKVYSMGVGGSGYMNDGAGEQAFYKRVNSIPTDADVVTIFGSGNDLSFELGNPTDTELDTICGCINNTITTLFRDFPLITLGIITPSPWASYNPANKENKMELYANALVEICKMRGIPCLDLYHCSGLRPWEETFRALAYSKDGDNGVHPDETGHAIIAPRIKAFLRSLVL